MLTCCFCVGPNAEDASKHPPILSLRLNAGHEGLCGGRGGSATGGGGCCAAGAPGAGCGWPHPPTRPARAPSWGSHATAYIVLEYLCVTAILTPGPLFPKRQF